MVRDRQHTLTASLVLFNTSTDVLSTLFSGVPDSVPIGVVDNSPSSALKTFIDGIPAAVYCHASENLGYGKGHNLAVAMLPPSKYHLILNPDIVIPSGAVESMIGFLEKSPDIALLGPRLLNPDGTAQHLNRRFPTVLDLLLRRLPEGLRIPAVQKMIAHHEMRDIGYDVVSDVPCMSGSFMLCRRSALDGVGGFDPHYFMYFEDFDLCCALREKGWRTVYYPSVGVTHAWERASTKEIRMTLVHIRSMIYFFNKWGWRWC